MRFKFSVVIPTYKRPELLRNCLNCLLNQDLDRNEFEVLVVCDGPDPATAALVEKFGGNFHCLQLHTRQGPAVARNLGWKNANAQLIAFTDDDCLPDKHWLNAYWENYAGEDLKVMTGRVIVPIEAPITDYKKNIANLETADFITANCCCSKDALELVGGFDERYRMAWREDSDLEFKFLQHEIHIDYKVEASVIHPVRAARWGVSLREQKKSMYNALLYQRFPEIYRRKMTDAIPVIFYLMAAATVGLIVGLTLNHSAAIWVSVLTWIACYASFSYRRIKNTSKHSEHVIEMLITSAIIPYLSLYWNYYGWWKFRNVSASSVRTHASSPARSGQY